jgi:Tol biopolymer transport system component
MGGRMRFLGRGRTKGRAVVLVLCALCTTCSDGSTGPGPIDLSELPGTIVFLSDREYGDTPLGPSRTELYAIRPDGSQERQLTDNDWLDNIAALTSAHPSGRSVLFERLMRTAPAVTVDIVSADLDGTVVAITHNLENGQQQEWATDPRWSPDGSRILSTTTGPDVLTIMSYAADGSDGHPFLPGSVTNDWKPRWSPTGEWVAFLSEDAVGDPWQCEVVRPDGSARRRIVADDACEGMAWAPDGSRVVFSSGGGYGVGSWSLWQAGVDGSSPARILQSRAGMLDLLSPVFSPTGDRLAFVARGEDNSEDIFIASADGSDVSPLVTGPGDDRSVAFSPDGRFVAFQTTRFGPVELMALSAEGGEPVRITETGFNRNPIWLSGR